MITLDSSNAKREPKNTNLHLYTDVHSEIILLISSLSV